MRIVETSLPGDIGREEGDCTGIGLDTVRGRCGIVTALLLLPKLLLMLPAAGPTGVMGFGIVWCFVISLKCL